MAERLQLHTERDHVASLLNGQISYEQFLTDIFQVPANRSQMCTALFEYHRNDGGSPEVHDFELQNFEFDAEHMKGRFRCRFEVKYHFTCSDVHNRSFDTIDWDLTLEPNTGLIDLKGEEILTPE